MLQRADQEEGPVIASPRTRRTRELLFDPADGKINFALRLQPFEKGAVVQAPIVATNKTKALKAAATIIARMYGMPDATVDIDPKQGKVRLWTSDICYVGRFTLEAFGRGISSVVR